LVPINGQQIVDEEENEPPPILCRGNTSFSFNTLNLHW
jgi:hypothetical protein